MDGLTLFGLVAVAAMLVVYALEHRSSAYVLAFAFASLAAAAYGFLQGAWPFGVVEIAWAGVAVQRWRRRVLLERASAAIADGSNQSSRT